MAANRAKRECKIPKRFIDEFAEAKPKNYKKVKSYGQKYLSSGDNTGWQSEKHG